MEYVYFEDWLKDEGYGSKDSLICEWVSDGLTEDERNEKIELLYGEFEEWAEENNSSPQYC